MPTRYYSSVARPLQLKTGIDAATTTLVADHPADYKFVSGEPYIMALQRGTLNEELVLMRGGTATGGTATWTQCTRGYDGTTARSHPAGAKMEHVTAAVDFREQQAALDARYIEDAMRPGYGAKPFIRRIAAGARPGGNWTSVGTVPAGQLWIVNSILLNNLGPTTRSGSIGVGLSGGDLINPVEVAPYSSLEMATALVYNAGEIVSIAVNHDDLRVTMMASVLETARFPSTPNRFRHHHLLPSQGFVSWTVPFNLVLTQCVVAMIGAGHTGYFSLTVQDLAYHGRVRCQSGRPLLLDSPIVVNSGEVVKVANDAVGLPGNTDGYMSIALYGHALLS